MKRGFCRDCGSVLFFNHRPDHPIGIAVGVFEADPCVRIAVHIYTDKAGPWYEIPGDDNRDTKTWRQTIRNDLPWVD